jgi:hypothetical protein
MTWIYNISLMLGQTVWNTGRGPGEKRNGDKWSEWNG